MVSVRRDKGVEVGMFGLTLALASLSATRVQAADLPPLWGGPLAGAPAPEAPAPFHLGTDAQTRDRATACLASAIYYEAASQSREGQEAVAQVVLNRVRHPIYPKSVCGVVYQGAPHRGCQFTFACDGSLARSPEPSAWSTARDIAGRALGGFVDVSVGASTHYHATWMRPAWSAALTPTRRIGGHQFYRMPGDAPSLTGVYAGVEPEISLTTPALQVAYRTPRPGPSFSVSPPARSSEFSVWGVQVAVVTPGRGGPVVTQAPGS